MGLDMRKPVFGDLRTTKVCASVQSDHGHLFYWLIGKYHIYTCNKGNFTFLASLCSWIGWFGHDLVGNPEDRFSRVATHIVSTIRDLIIAQSCTLKGLGSA